MNGSTGILTTHRVHNCGSFLQAYALQVTLKRMGYKSEYIDYIPTAKGQSLNRYDAPVRFRTIIRYLARDVWHRRWKFVQDDIKLLRWEWMLRSKLNISRRTYATLDDLVNNCPVYDRYIVGSDQVWNERFTKNDTAFMLSFAPVRSRKISYASSVGNTHWESKFEENVKKHLSSFYKISCRERANSHTIGELLKKEVASVLDPVLLLTPDIWLHLLRIKESKSKYDSYIFFFMLDYMQDIRQQALSVLKDATHNNSESVVWSNKTIPEIDARIVEIDTPSSFVKTIQNARLVISDSFHAIAFSLLFNVPVMRVDTQGKTDVRIDDLCQRIAFSEGNTYCLDNDKYEKEKAASLSFLRDALSA